MSEYSVFGNVDHCRPVQCVHMQLGAGCRGQNSQFPLVNDGRSSVGGAILASNWAITITSPGTARSATSGYDQAANFGSYILSI